MSPRVQLITCVVLFNLVMFGLYLGIQHPAHVLTEWISSTIGPYWGLIILYSILLPWGIWGYLVSRKYQRRR